MASFIAMLEYSVSHNGLTDFSVRFRAVRDYRDEILDTMKAAADAGMEFAQRNVPFRSGELYRAVGKTPLKYFPGGAGGGGNYEITIGVDRQQAPHARHVLYGSGIYSQEEPGGNVEIDEGGTIKPSMGNVMVFTTDIGEKVFTMSTKGQYPRDEWWVGAQEIANAVIRQKIQRT